jgi:hypothetical protein
MKILLAAAVAAMSMIAAPAHAATPDPVFPRGLPAAPSEDGCYVHRCVWDAKHQGNGEGHSVILTRFHGDYIAKRITHRRAHRLQAAYCARPSVDCRGYAD